MGTTARWWREYVGAVSLLLCSVCLIAYLAVVHKLSVMVGARALGALYALNVVPGYLALRFVFRIRLPSAFEAMLASLLLGVLITPLMWHALCGLGIGGFFLPALYAVAAILPFACGWIRQPVARLKALVCAADAPILWLAVLFAILWSHQIGLVRVDDGQASVIPFSDHRLHATIVAELSRGVPMESVPFLAGARKFAYHHMSDVWAAMMQRATGVGSSEVYLYLALPLRYLFVAFGLYLALVRRFGRGAALAGTCCVLGLAIFPTQVAAGVPGPKTMVNELLHYIYVSYPFTFGLPAVCLVLYSASILSKRNPRGPLLLAAVVSALLPWYKAQLALPVAPAVALLYSIVLIRRRDYQWLGVCAAAQALLAGIRYLDLSTADAHGTFVFIGVNYMYEWWAGLHVPSVLGGIRPWVENLPWIFQWPVIYAVCLIFTFHVGLVVPVYLLFRRRRAGLRGEETSGDLLTLLILLCCLIGWVVFPIQKGFNFNISAPIVFMVHALLLSLLGAAGWELVCRVLSHRRGVRGIATIAAVAVLTVNGVILRQTTLVLDRPHATVSEPLLEAYRYVRENTPSESLVLVPDYQGDFVAGLLTERRVVLESCLKWRKFFQTYDVAQVKMDVADFYARFGSKETRRILKRYGVGYVVVDLSRTTTLPEQPHLVQVFRNRGVAVYRAEQDLALASLE